MLLKSISHVQLCDAPLANSNGSNGVFIMKWIWRYRMDRKVNHISIASNYRYGTRSGHVSRHRMSCYIDDNFHYTMPLPNVIHARMFHFPLIEQFRWYLLNMCTPFDGFCAIVNDIRGRRRAMALNTVDVAFQYPIGGHTPHSHAAYTVPHPCLHIQFICVWDVHTVWHEIWGKVFVCKPNCRALSWCVRLRCPYEPHTHTHTSVQCKCAWSP